MSAEELVQKGPKGFRQATGGARLVVLYPRNRYRNAFLSRYLSVPNSGYYYYALQTSDRNLRKFLVNLVEDLNALTGHFGSHVRAALAAKAKAPELAEALCGDLNELSSDPFAILFDQYDRLPEKDETKRFMEALVECIPSQCQVVINAREQAYMPWFDLVSAQKAAVLGAEYVPEAGAFEVETPETPRVAAYSLGSGHALVNGAPVTQWDGELPRNLFFFFMDHPLVTRDEIFDAFWPTLSVKEATNVFHVTKRKINERLGYDLTQYSGGFYSHSEDLDIYYDVAEFTKLIEQAMAAEGKAQIDLWQKAVALYRAPFLHRLDMDWTKARRKELQQQHAQALIGLGRNSQAKGDINKALSYYNRALSETPEREDIHRQVMELYHQQGKVEEAVAQYQKLEKALRETLGILPSPETVSLFEKIKGG